MLIFMFIIGNSILMYVHPLVSAVGQDAWISCLLAVIPALLVTLMAVKTGLYNPELSFLDNCRKLLGKWLGTAVVLVYLVHWISAVGSILNHASDFIIVLLLSYTPNLVIIVSLVLLAAYAVIAGGIESIGRLGEVFGLICLFGLFLIFLMLIPLSQPSNLLPVYYDHGWLAIVRAAIYPLAFKAEAVWLLAIFPFLTEPDKAMKTTALGILTIAAVGTVTLLFVIMVLSPEMASRELYPTFDVVSFISIMNFIQNLEIILVLAWLLSSFLRLCIYLFLASHTMAQLFGIKRWKRVVWPLSVFALVQAWVTLAYKINVLPVLSNTWLTYIFPWTLMVFPLMLFAAGFIRQKIGGRNGRKKSSA